MKVDLLKITPVYIGGRLLNGEFVIPVAVETEPMAVTKAIQDGDDVVGKIKIFEDKLRILIDEIFQ